MHPSLNGVRTFTLTARSRSFSAAARQLSVTQGAVSQQIARLEAYLGTRLFDRSGRRLTLTTTGRRMFLAVADSIDRIDTAVATVHARPDHEVLNLTTLSSFAAQWLLPRLAQFETRHPHVRVRIESTPASLDLSRSELDAGIRFGSGVWPGLDSDYLFEESTIAVATPEFAATLALEDGPMALASTPLLFDLDASDEGGRWFDGAVLTGITPNLAYGYSDTLVLLSALLNQQQGVALVPGHLVQAELSSGRLVRLFEHHLNPTGAFYLIRPAERPPRPPTALFRDWLLEAAAEQAGAARRTGSVLKI